MDTKRKSGIDPLKLERKSARRLGGVAHWLSLVHKRGPVAQASGPSA